MRCYESSAGSAHWTTYDSVLGIDGRGNKYFTWFFVGWSGDSGQYTKYYFDAQAKKPVDLQASNDTSLILQYNITLGGKVVDFPVNGDSSWHSA